jgi:transcriptional regulator with GAF, ATPase, and Fis domain
MPPSNPTEPWPRLRDVVEASVTGLHRGRFIEETLEALCVQLGAASAWSTLETKGSGPMHRSRTMRFRGVAPAILAMHVSDVLDQVHTKLKTVAGSVPYAPDGSFIAVPLWSQPAGSSKGRSLVGALYMEFAKDQGTKDAVVGVVETAGALLGGLIAQQTVIEDTKEDLRAERATEQVGQNLTLDELLAPESMRSIGDELRTTIGGDESIMILGESGTGKTQLATAFAHASNQVPIVRATLGLADDLNTITSELFGHERGSFSGAVSKRKGLVEYAHEGTLIFDEVLNLTHHAQQLLLDFTQFGSYRPLGFQGPEPKAAKVRIISVTNGDMQRAVAERAFRQDLYYRLAAVPLTLPPLRERRWDIPNIAVRYLKRIDPKTDWELSGGATEALLSPQLQWGGNIRELEAVLKRAKNRARAGGSEDPVIEARHFDLGEGHVPSESRPPSVRPSSDPALVDIRERWRGLSGQQQDLESLERGVIEDALAACHGIVARTARMLDIPRTGLISRMGRLDIDAEQFKERRG